MQVFWCNNAQSTAALTSIFINNLIISILGSITPFNVLRSYNNRGLFRLPRISVGILLLTVLV